MVARVDAPIDPVRHSLEFLTIVLREAIFEAQRLRLRIARRLGLLRPTGRVGNRAIGESELWVGGDGTAIRLDGLGDSPGAKVVLSLQERLQSRQRARGRCRDAREPLGRPVQAGGEELRGELVDDARKTSRFSFRARLRHNDALSVSYIDASSCKRPEISPTLPRT